MSVAGSSQKDGGVIRRQRMSVEKRYRIIEALDQGMTRNQVIDRFHLKHSSNITTILKSREAIIREMEKGTRPSAKAIRNQKFPMIDEALTQLIHEAAAAGQTITRQMLAQKALFVARKYGVYYRYKLTRGYLDKFLAQHMPLEMTPVPEDVQMGTDDCHLQDQDAGPTDLKEHLVHSMRISATLFLNQLDHAICRRMDGHGMESHTHLLLQRCKNQLLEELVTNLNSVFAALHDLRDKETPAFVEIADDLMQHHLALGHILISQFYQTVQRLVDPMIHDQAAEDGGSFSQ